MVSLPANDTKTTESGQGARGVGSCVTFLGAALTRQTGGGHLTAGLDLSPSWRSEVSGQAWAGLVLLKTWRGHLPQAHPSPSDHLGHFSVCSWHPHHLFSTPVLLCVQISPFREASASWEMGLIFGGLPLLRGQRLRGCAGKEHQVGSEAGASGPCAWCREDKGLRWLECWVARASPSGWGRGDPPRVGTESAQSAPSAVPEVRYSELKLVGFI